MTSEEYRGLLERLDLTQVAAARMLDIDPRTSRYYALGEYPVPVKIAGILRLMAKFDVEPDEFWKMTKRDRPKDEDDDDDRPASNRHRLVAGQY